VPAPPIGGGDPMIAVAFIKKKGKIMSPYRVEQADFLNVPNKIEVASNSLDCWIKHRQTELCERHCALSLKFEQESDAGRRAELAKKISQAEKELQDFSEGVKNSSMRRAFGGGRESVVSVDNFFEQRFMPVSSPVVSDISIESRPAGAKKKLCGLAAIYDSWTEIGHYYKERIRIGAFSDVVKNCDCRCLLNHDSNLIFARTTNGTLRLTDVKNVGLVFWADCLNGDEATDSLIRRVNRGDISGCSFCFVVGKDEWSLARRLGELDERTIVSIDKLYDVGPVTFPAYPKTNIVVVFERQKTQSFDDFIEEENQDFDRRFKLTQLQKRIGLSFEQRFELGRIKRKAERLRNLINAGA